MFESGSDWCRGEDDPECSREPQDTRESWERSISISYPIIGYILETFPVVLRRRFAKKERIESCELGRRFQVFLATPGFAPRGAGCKRDRRLTEPVEGDFWQADHEIPVSEGGGCCSLENIRTLCVPCHRLETEKLRVRLNDTKNQTAAKGAIFILGLSEEASAAAFRTRFLARLGNVVADLEADLVALDLDTTPFSTTRVRSHRARSSSRFSRRCFYDEGGIALDAHALPGSDFSKKKKKTMKVCVFLLKKPRRRVDGEPNRSLDARVLARPSFVRAS